jgi:hypothetical protein
MAKINLFKALPSFKNKKASQSEESLYSDGEFTPTLPVANLIPSLVLTNRKKEKTIRQILLNITTILLVFALAWVASFAYSSLQQLNEGNIESKIVEIETQKQGLTGYELRRDFIDEMKTTGVRLFSAKIDMALAFKYVAEAADKNDVVISSFAITGTETAEQSSCTSSSPFEPISQIGCISVSASTSGGSVNGFLESLLNINGFFSDSSSSEGIYKSYMSGIMYGEDGSITFTIKIPVTVELLSSRNSYFSGDYNALLGEANRVAALDVSSKEQSVKEWLDGLLGSVSNGLAAPSVEAGTDQPQPEQTQPEQPQAPSGDR